MSCYDDLINIIRREAQNIHFHSEYKGTLVCTSYDPKQHAIKGMIVPSMVESDWIPIGVTHAGDGFGILVGPKVGSADALDGDQFHIQFEGGDPDSPMAVHKHFSTVDNPPEVQSGEMLLQHESGNKMFFDKDKKITIQHGVSQGTLVADENGHWTLTTKDKNFTVDAGSGSHTLKAQNISLTGAIAVTGDITQQGSHTLSGVVAASDVTSGGQQVQTV